MKIISFYLPQFHTIPENDEWWGKGFTDWNNVKKGKRIFPNQEQPRVPLNNNYYDLSNVDTLKWQSKLMQDYNVYGQCFYHYWFDGNLLLEKPAEILLNNKNILINFCFSWANEPWARTWDGKNKDILMPQHYGSFDDWVKHFNYLLPFFKDDRYIKIENKPMFLLYKPSSIKDCEAMMNCWNKMAIDNGFYGIHFVNTLRGKGDEKRNLPFSANVEFEPSCSDYNVPWAELTIRRIRRVIIKCFNSLFKTSIPLSKPWKFSYIAKISLKRISPQNTYAGAFVGWDNTPRKGTAGTVILPATKKEFEEYLKNKIEIAKKYYSTDFLFVNAWNEWAEGTYLEPDKIHKYDYLEVIKDIGIN